MDTPSIAQAFGNYFEIRLATTPELLEQVYRIRYRVYCQEFGYEAEERFPNRMERDEYDQCAQHSLLIHRQDTEPVGCIRLIKSGQHCQLSLLPFESFCSPVSDFGVDPRGLPRDHFGELSRLAVVDTFRRRQKDEKKPVSLTEDDVSEPSDRRSRFPFIPVSLFVAGIAMFLRTPAELTFAMMEPRLVRLLQRFGIIFTQAGELVDYHGPRAAFVLPRETAVSALRSDVRELFSYVDEQLFGGTIAQDELAGSPC